MNVIVKNQRFQTYFCSTTLNTADTENVTGQNIIFSSKFAARLIDFDAGFDFVSGSTFVCFRFKQNVI